MYYYKGKIDVENKKKYLDNYALNDLPIDGWKCPCKIISYWFLYQIMFLIVLNFIRCLNLLEVQRQNI